MIAVFCRFVQLTLCKLFSDHKFRDQTYKILIKNFKMSQIKTDVWNA